MVTTSGEPPHEDLRKAEFERVMRYVTERAWADGREQEAMAVLFDVLNGAPPESRLMVARPVSLDGVQS
jgi:hypothetical protein